MDPPSDDWQELLHERKDALPQPVLKRWHADPTQIGLLRNAGQSCAPAFAVLSDYFAAISLMVVMSASSEDMSCRASARSYASAAVRSEL